MAAGPITLPVQDANAVTRNVLTWSSTGLLTGNLSPLQAILGVDGATIATAANAFPVTLENASIAITAAALPLPTGAATSALQTTGNTSLAAIATSVAALPVAKSTIVSGQQKIATTGTALALTSGSNPLGNSVRVKASIANVGQIAIGPSGVTNTFDGTGNGDILNPGDVVILQVTNTNAVFINGTIGDFVSFSGT